MPAELLLPTARATDADGNVYAGAKWTFFATGTTTPQNVYADADLNTSLGHVVTADSGGKFVPIYFDAGLSYRGICENSSGSTTLHDIDPINSGFGTGGGSGLVGFSHAETYPAGSIGLKGQQTVNPMDAPYSAAGDGAADDRAALAAADTAAYAAGVPLYITGRHRIASNLTLQSDLVFIGGTLEPVTATTTTCEGIVTGGLSPLFAGAGSVVGIREVRPEWFGAVRDGTTDDAPAINEAWTCVAESADSRGPRPTMLFAAGSYGIASTVRVAPTLNIPLKMTGQGWAIGGTRFQVLSSFDDTDGAMALHIDGNTDVSQKVASIEIGDFGIIPYTAGATDCTIGLQVGTVGKDLIGVQQSQVRDIHLSDGFVTPMNLLNFRLIDFNRCSTWNRTLTGGGSAVKFPGDATGPLFTGDINFNSCQFVGHTGVGLVQINPSVSTYQVRGIRFNNCTWYHSDKSLEMSPSGGAIVGDIWVNPGCQFDGQQRNAVHMYPTGANTVLDNIHIDGCYFRGIDTGYNAVDFGALSSARCDSIWVTGNWFANIADGSKAVLAQDCSNVHIDFNSLTECNSTTAEMILLAQNVLSFTVIGNTLKQVTGITVDHLVTIGTGSNYGAAVHNSTNGSASIGSVQVLSAGANLTTTPNW